MAAPDADPEQSARNAGLRYVTDTRPGIRRVRSGKGFRYTGPDGDPVRDKETLARIKALAIPPAWTDVWICPHENGHLQATGRDEKGRKQYRYHPRWHAVRDETKYHRLIAFAAALPVIRAHVETDLARPGLPREKVLATVVRLLETTFIRVGNEEYARKNNSYGLTTLKSRHAEVNGSQVTFQFRGKSAKFHQVDVKDARLARIVARCQSLPGQDLFQYLDEEGTPQSIGSADVNAYLKEITGEEFTAKDFRTWAGTLLAALALCGCKPCTSPTLGKREVARAITEVAARLGNTPAVCRKSYVHPAIIDAYLDGTLTVSLARRVRRTGAEAGGHPLSRHERAVVALLERRLKESPKGGNGTRKAPARPRHEPRARSRHA